MDLYKIRSELSKGISINSMPLKVTYYSRVSTEHDEQINSLKNQVNHFDEMIINNKNWTYVEGYVDAGISGTTDYKRDNFMRMIDDAKLGKFDLIITKEISRFSRNTLDSIKYTRILLDYGVAVYFFNDNINTILPDSELRLTIMASMAQDEVRRLSERVKFGMHRSIKNGNILGNNLLYGYDKVQKSLVINKEESIVVKRLFTMYAIDKISLTKIAQSFNQEGIKTSLNKKWNVTTLSRMISNPKYKGYYCGKKSEVIDYMSKKVKKFCESEWVMYEDSEKIPPIVDEKLFYLANKRLKENQKVFSNGNNKNMYPFSSKIECLCGSFFNRRKMSKNKDEIIWFCPKCKISIRQSELFYIIKNALRIDKKKLVQSLNNLYKKFIDNKNSSDYTYQIAKLNKRKEKLLELNINNFMSNSEFKNLNDECNNKILELEKNLNKNEDNQYNSRIINYLDKYLKSDTFFEELIKNSIEKIYVFNSYKDGISISLKCPFLNKKEKNKYQFKRGYDTVGTRRYLFFYEVYIN